MGASAIISDGKLVERTDTTKPVNTADKSSGLGKDDFLQLLVAEMKYQDPLEPTSNTDYIAQYAQFSQVEALTNMQESNELANATALVGKYVTMNVTSKSGVQSQVSGKVEYVNSSGGNVYLYIDGNPYNYDNLDTVWDDSYLEANEYADVFRKAVKSLPSAEEITLDYYDQVATLLNAYNSLSEYQKSFIGEEYTTKLTELGNVLMKLKAEQDAAKAEESAENSGDDNAETTGE